MIKLKSLITENYKKSGLVNINKIVEVNDWEVGNKKFMMEFSVSIPNERMELNKGKTYEHSIVTEMDYQSLKQYENKLVEAKWEINEKNEVKNFSVMKVVGNIQNGG